MVQRRNFLLALVGLPFIDWLRIWNFGRENENKQSNIYDIALYGNFSDFFHEVSFSLNGDSDIIFRHNHIYKKGDFIRIFRNGTLWISGFVKEVDGRGVKLFNPLQKLCSVPSRISLRSRF